MALPTIAYEGNSFQKFLSWTDEKKVLGHEIRGLVRQSCRALLDVGAGNGDLTHHYLDRFETAYLIEPAWQYSQTLLNRFPHAVVIKTRVENFHSRVLRFDCIVASHVLTYVADPLSTVTRLYAALRPGGRFVIVMLNSDCGYSKFVDAFAGEVLAGKGPAAEVRWHEVTAYLAAQQLAFRVIDAASHVNAPSMAEFLSLNDLHFSTEASQLTDSVYCKMQGYLQPYVAEAGLVIDMGHKIICIEKQVHTNQPGRPGGTQPILRAFKPEVHPIQTIEPARPVNALNLEVDAS